MSRNPSRLRFAALLAVPLVSVGLVGPASAALVNISSVSGSAYGESVAITVPVAINSAAQPSVSLPAAGGGPFTDSLASVSEPGALSTGLLEVSTEGALGPAGFSASSASVADVVIASAISASAVTSSCRSDINGSTGDATILDVNGDPMAAPAGTVIPLPGLGEIRLNEQIPEGDGTTATGITVNAIHVVFNGAALQGDVIIAQSHCDANDDGTGVPVGAIGGLALTALLGAGLAVWTVVARRRTSQV